MTHDTNTGGDGRTATPGGETPGARSRPGTAEIEAWLVSYLADLLGTAPDRVSTRISFSRYGLDSSASIAMASALSDWLGREVDPTINYSYPTIDALARHLGE